MAKRNETGKDGESVARAFLEKQGYKITHTNWHWHHYRTFAVFYRGQKTLRTLDSFRNLLLREIVVASKRL